MNPEIFQENHYPFGMTIAPLSQSPESGKNKYPYNSKEHHADLGLHWTDYGARWYDAQLGRWHSVDPLADELLNHSPYNYTLNNPVLLIDPTGAFPINDITIDQDGSVTSLVENDQPHRLFLQNGIGGQNIELRLNDPTIDPTQLGNAKIGDKLVHFLNPENVNYIMNDAGVLSWYSCLLSNIPDVLSTIAGATLSHHGRPIDFGYAILTSQLLALSENENVPGYKLGLSPGDDYNLWDTHGGFLFFNDSGINTVYNVPDAGNFLWGHAMTRLGASTQAMIIGSNVHALGGDVPADQQAILSGSLYAHRLMDPISNILGYPTVRPSWFYFQGSNADSYGRK